MSFFTLVISSLAHHWRSNLAVGLGVAAATAVLTGALLVGDSVRYSLRQLTLERLGEIDEALTRNGLFRAQLVDETIAYADAEFGMQYNTAVPAILLQGSLKNQEKGSVAGGATVLGINDAFWKLGEGGPARSPVEDEIVLNQRLASDLDVQAGDEVVLQIGRESSIPADSPLGRKTETVRRRTLKISEIIPGSGLGRFGLHPNQQLPANAYVAIATLQDMLDADGKINTIFVDSKAAGSSGTKDRMRTLNEIIQPSLVDYGLKVGQHDVAVSDERTTQVFTLTSDRMLLKSELANRLDLVLPKRTQPSLTYLANWITAGDRRIPYSTVTAINSTAQLGPLLTEGGAPILLADDEIVLNSWAAEDLAVMPGDMIELTFFEPDTTHGEVAERTESFRLKAIVPLSTEDGKPTAAADPTLTPTVKGITDQESIDDWDPPFPFDSARVRDKDDKYWEEHRATPKAFVSLQSGRRMWGSRFGDTTSVRVIAAAGDDLQSMAKDLATYVWPSQESFTFQPVKQQGLQAASGTTPFDVLFLLFSMFLIAAALMLVALLFRLNVEQRAQEIGLLLAVGFSRKRVRKVIAVEALLVAGDGAFFGALLGIGYAWLMIHGLRTWWVEAVSTPFLQLHVPVTSLVLGIFLGLIVCGLTILWSLRQLRTTAVRRLLSGEVSQPQALIGRRSLGSNLLAGTCLLLAIVLIPVAMNLGGEAQAGAFFGAGALVLIAGLLWVRSVLRSRGAGSTSMLAMHFFSLLWLAGRNAARNPDRSTLTIGLVAAASFLIVAVSAFRLDDSDAHRGGFDLFAEADVPLYYDLGSEDGRFELGVSGEAEELLATASVASFRVKHGDDASCRNLYQSRQPRVLGVPEGLPDEFLWAAQGDVEGTPWQLLKRELPAQADGRARVPVVIDQNTAYYSLQLYGIGATLDIKDGSGRPATLEVVGLLKNSAFQGDLLIGEANFLKLFPTVSGYRLFLIQSPEGQSEALQVALENDLADFGFDATSTRERLAGFFAVQNTYLSTFQSLGGLGLLLGTLGLAAVQLRNVITRRGELALLRATGFRRERLAAAVLVENALLLITGLGIGVVAAAISVSPHMASGSAKVPWPYLAGTLGLVLIVGIIAGLAAVRATLRAPVIQALRGD